MIESAGNFSMAFLYAHLFLDLLKYIIHNFHIVLLLEIPEACKFSEAEQLTLTPRNLDYCCVTNLEFFVVCASLVVVTFRRPHRPLRLLLRPCCTCSVS